MYFNIQSYQKKITNKLWRPDTKRRNSVPNLKKDALNVNGETQLLDYDIEEENKLITQYNDSRRTLHLNNENNDYHLHCMDYCSKLRLIRTIKMPQIEIPDKGNCKLEAFCVSYNKDFAYLKSKYEGYNRMHLNNQTINYDTLMTEAPVYEVSSECDLSASFSGDMMDIWESQALDNIPSDPLITGLLNDLSSEAAVMQSLKLRQKFRQHKLFNLYTAQDPDKQIELRPVADFPREIVSKSVKVFVKSFKLEFDIEPIFGNICLYDLKNRKKISENFYFDFNNANKFKMMDEKYHHTFLNRSPQANSCIFHVENLSDIFLVIRLEKILQQGDINEIADVYMKEDKHKSKVRTQIEWACKNLAKYRMPFAFYAIELQKDIQNNLFHSSTSVDNCSINSGTQSVKSSRVSTNSKRHALESCSVRSASQSQPKDINLLSDNSPEDDEFGLLNDNLNIPLRHISNFYRQESEKMSDEDLFKWLQDTRKGGNNAKRIKFIPCQMDIEISYIDEMNSNEFILSPEQIPLANKYQSPRSSKNDFSDRPVMDILEFSAERRFIANATYRNLLYVYPKSVNFSSKQGSIRNITIKIQFFQMENDKPKLLKLMYGKMNGPKLTTETFTKVLYHNKYPDFNDEIKIQLPGKVTVHHFLMFTFYHVSCQPNKKIESSSVETLIGFSWLPLLDNDILCAAEHSLLVSSDKPTPASLLRKPDLHNNIENVHWLESHKELFRVFIQPVSTVHSEVPVIEHFNNSVSNLRYNKSKSSTDEDLERDKLVVVENVKMLESSPLDELIQFSSVIFDNLLWLSLESSLTIFPGIVNTHQYFLNVLAALVNRITNQSSNRHENLNRDSILLTYATYAACLPGLESEAEFSRCWSFYLKNEKCLSEINAKEAYLNPENYNTTSGLFHEDFLSRILQSIDAGVYELIIDNLWFFLEVLTRGMKEHFHYVMSMKKSDNNQPVFSNLFINKLIKLSRFAIQQIDRYMQMKDFSGGDDLLFTLTYQHQKNFQNLIRNIAMFYNTLLSFLNLDIMQSLIVNFMELINARIDLEKGEIARLLISLKLEFLRIVSDTEHFFTLNNVDSNSLLRQEIHTQISETYVENHFFLALILTELKLCLKSGDFYLQSVAIHIVWNLIASHESDPRYMDPLIKSSIADLYLPLVTILFDSIKFVLPSKNAISDKMCQSVCNDNSSSLDYKIPQTDYGIGLSTYSSPVDPIETEPDNINTMTALDLEGNSITSDNSRHLLLCFVWIMKNLDSQSFMSWLNSFSSFKVNKLLHLLILTAVNFEFKSGRDNRNNRLIVDDCKSSSPDILHIGEIKKQISICSRRSYLSNSLCVMEGKLCMEIVFVMLDSLDIIMKVFESNPQSAHIIINIFKIIIKSLQINQSVATIQSVLAFQRLLIKKYYKTIFDEAINLCGDLCKCLLKLAGSNLKEIRSHAVASLYMLMRYNFQIDNTFARIKLQITMALSKLVWDREDSKQKRIIELNLNASLRTIIAYSAVEKDLQNNQSIDYEDTLDYISFADQVEELMLNLRTILTDTVKMRQFEDDPEMQIDLMARIAKGYQNSPDLRLTWLQRMAQKHTKLNNKAEAGMCLAHCVGIVAEYLGMKEPLPYMPVGCVQIAEALGINLLEESAISDDVVSPDEDGVCCDELFTQNGLIKLIRMTTQFFRDASMYELIPKMNRIVLPILEENENFILLSDLHKEIKDAYDSIQTNKDKRIFATFFRVCFYGDNFKELNNQEFIYKEPPFTKLPEMSAKFESFYTARFGKDKINILKDSNIVNPNTLDKDKMSIQITFAEPYFEMAELRRRKSAFDQNYNLKNFVFSTPYTLDGKAHGELKDQYKRKTILTTEKAFPYIKTRIRVIRKHQIDLTPIEVAYEDLSRKVDQLTWVLSKEPIDIKYLQMTLQGSLGTTVNQGPVELATSFLSTNDKFNGAHYNKLRLCFKEFLRRCEEGLVRNHGLITADQQKYQRELEKNFIEISNQLNPLLHFNSR